MFSCRKASSLISDSLDRELTRGERFAMRFHLCICRVCRRFRHQLRFLHQETEAEFQAFVTLEAEDALSPEARKRIQDRLAQDMNER